MVEDGSGFAWSLDGSRLAYVEMDRNLGEAHLVVEEVNKGDKVTIATLAIPKGSGSSIPNSANLNWSPDGKILCRICGRRLLGIYQQQTGIPHGFDGRIFNFNDRNTSVIGRSAYRAIHRWFPTRQTAMEALKILAPK